MVLLSAKAFLAKVAEDKKDSEYPKKLAADQCDARDMTDPANPAGDAYYEALGAELEAHPLRGRLGIRGG